MFTLMIVSLACLVYSSISIFTKQASSCDFLSLSYILWIGGELTLFFVYAILWQKLLSLLPLSAAYITKSLSIIFVLLICIGLYNEEISLNKILGVCLIIIGLLVYPWEKNVG